MSAPNAPTPPPRTPAPLRNPSMPAAPAASAPRKQVTFGTVKPTAGHRVAIYAPGGWGKTTLAAHAPGPVAFIDLDDSLPILWPKLEEEGIASNILPVEGIKTWGDLTDVMNRDGWDSVKTIVIDTLTKAEEMSIEAVLKTIPHEKGGRVECLQDYGFGKGMAYAYDMFLPLLASIDAHCRAGRNVVMICHECSATFPNPMGADYLRYEPRLQSPNSGKASIRLRVREFVDHLLCGLYDVSIDKNGKGMGCGSRTIYAKEMPYCMAKSRTISDPIPYENNAEEIWRQILGIK